MPLTGRQEPIDGARVGSCLAESFEVSRWVMFTNWALVPMDFPANYDDVQTTTKAKQRALEKGALRTPLQWKTIQ